MSSALGSSRHLLMWQVNIMVGAIRNSWFALIDETEAQYITVLPVRFLEIQASTVYVLAFFVNRR